MAEKTTAFLLLGSNIGQRKANLHRAIQLLEQRIGPIVAKSHLYETEPWGVHDQPHFINQAIALCTSLPPTTLLHTLKTIEREMGRTQTVRWHARLIDIDILLYGDHIIESQELCIPHPGLAQRNFALVPLMEIAATYLHPVLGKTIEELYFGSKDSLEVYRIEDE